MSKIPVNGASQAPKIERKNKQHDVLKKAGRASVLGPDEYNSLKGGVARLRAAFPGCVKFSRQDKYIFAPGDVIELPASVIIDDSKPDGFKVLLGIVGQPGGYGRAKDTAFRNAEEVIDQSEVVKISKTSAHVSVNGLKCAANNEHAMVKQIDGINSPLIERQNAQGELKLYMSMKRRQGKEVYDWYANGDFLKLETGELIAVLQAIHRAVQSFHEKGYSHNDIKPENIMLRRDEHGQFHADLIDFGFVRSFGSPFENVGTLGYKHPDLMRIYQCPVSHNRTGKWVDLHALAGVFGFVLYSLTNHNDSRCMESKYGKNNDFEYYNFDPLYFQKNVSREYHTLLIALLKQLEGRKKGHEDELSHEQIAACLSLIQLLIACQAALKQQKASGNPSEQLEISPVDPAEFARIQSLINGDERLNDKSLKTAFDKVVNQINTLTQQPVSVATVDDREDMSRASPASASPERSSGGRSPEPIRPLERPASQSAQLNFIAATYAAFATMLKAIASAISTAFCYLCPTPQAYDQKPVLGGAAAFFSEQAFCLTGSPEHLVQIACCG